jgi:hypothetical protein
MASSPSSAPVWWCAYVWGRIRSPQIAILRLAAPRLDPDLHAAVHDDEWLPELAYILKGDEARPITRLYHGTRFALGILVAARCISMKLSRPMIEQSKCLVCFAASSRITLS